MRNFLFGIIAALAIGAGAYYFVTREVPDENQIWEEWGEQQENKPANRIPEGAIMEDGTLPE